MITLGSYSGGLSGQSVAFVTDVLGEERELVLACQAGEEVALSAFYERFFASVYRYALAATGKREDAEDVTGEVFVKALRGIGAFRFSDAERGGGPFPPRAAADQRPVARCSTK